MSWCPNNQCIWVQVIDGPTYQEGWDTRVCVTCGCHNAWRIADSETVQQIAADVVKRRAGLMRRLVQSGD